LFRFTMLRNRSTASSKTSIEYMTKTFSKTAAAMVVYLAAAIYLYQPQFKKFNALQYLLIVNVTLACLGTFMLSRRWVAAFFGSLFAGAMYGFGAFSLGLAKFHPTVGFLAAGIPWLFCPASFIAKTKWRWLSWPLSALPFLVIVLFFWLTVHYRLFAVPIRAKLNLADLAGLVAPLVMVQRNGYLIGFYHVPIAALLMGFCMLFLARRFGIMIIFFLGTILACCEPFYNVSPIMWLCVPVLCCSILIGVGMQGFVLAGYADRNWILLTVIASGTLAIVTLLFAVKYFQVFAGLGRDAANLLIESAKMYILGTVTAAIIFFLARAKMRVSMLRWIILCSAMAVDIFLGARFIVDRTL
jgi:hypothetical protein